MGTLYVVATPIGNLEDVTLRALRVLREVSLVAAEDTRVARKLLDRYGITTRLMSFNDHNKSIRIPTLLDGLNVGDVALVSDAGTPAISDPGAELVAAARAAGHRVSPIPGASAVVSSLSASGLRSRTFRFAGFLPRQPGQLRRFFEGLAAEADTVVAFESPSRIGRSLRLLAGILPDRRLAVCRELTKVHEEIFFGTAAEAAERFPEGRGEFVLVIEGAQVQERGARPKTGAGAEDLAAEVRLLREAGLSRAQAAALMQARYGLPRRRLYDLWLKAGTPTSGPPAPPRR